MTTPTVSPPATIGLSKVLTGDAAKESWATDATFMVDVTCQREVTGADDEPMLATLFTQTLPIKGGETISALTDDDGNVVKLPVGTRRFGEATDAAGATAAAVSPSSYDEADSVKATDDAGDVQAMMVRATNTYRYGSLELHKVVDGDAAGFVGDREFTLDVSCVLPQSGRDTVILDGKSVTITGGGSETIDNLPVGAHCWAGESGPGGATAVAIDHGTREDAVVVGEDGAVSITATNTFEAAELTVGKTVVNGPVGPFGFTVSCTTNQGPVALAKGDATFTLEHGGSRRIPVPAGAQCTVAESPVKDATVTFEDSDGTHDGKVVVDGAASVQVTNTFADESGGNLPGDGGKPGKPGKPGCQMPNTGGPSMWLLVLGVMGTAVGAAVLASRRQRA